MKVRENIKYKLIIIYLIPLLYQIVSIRSLNSYILYIPFVILFVSIIYSEKIKKGKQYTMFGLSIMITYVYCSLLSLNITLSSLAYVGLILMFYFTIPYVGNLISLKFNEVIEKLLISNSIILTYQILVNIKNISLGAIESCVRFNESRVVSNRNFFGFPHPNTVAAFIVVELILICILIQVKKEKKITMIGVFGNVFFLIALLATGSRTAIISISLYYFFTLYLKFDYALGKSRLIIRSGIIILTIGIFSKLQLLQILVENSSGRDINLFTNIEILLQNDAILFGFGASKITALSIYGVSMIDNWYLYILVCYGFIGFISIILGLVTFLTFSIQGKSKEIKILMIPLIIMILIYGIAENVVFVPGVLLSVMFWIIYYALYKMKKIES